MHSCCFQLGLGGESHAQSWLSEEDYWQAVWPNTPIPTALQELLKSVPSGWLHNDELSTLDY